MQLNAHMMSWGTPQGVFDALRETNFGVRPKYYPRFIKMLAMGMPLASLGVIERAVYHHRVMNTSLCSAPIFILGHWRTGSTHLHNLLTRDPQFGFLSTFDAFATNNGLMGREFFKSFVQKCAPLKRPMDDMDIRMDFPQEEEFAMSNLSNLSYYKQFVFPQYSEHYAQRHLFFDGVSSEEVENWKKHYDFLLRRITFIHGPKTLLLKNPPNTARLRHLLNLYPTAKIIYIYRNPYDVYQSTLRMREKVCMLMKLHDFDHQASSEHVLSIYPQMIQRFFDDLPKVMPGNFIPISYENLKERPLQVVEKVYSKLNLPGFSEVQDQFQSYLKTVSEFQTTRYRVDPIIQEKIEQRWGQVQELHRQWD